MVVDYSKWNSIELSDDDSDCHPNIERNTWLRLKKESKLRKKQEEEEKAAKELAENEEREKRIEELEDKLRSTEDAALRAELDTLKARTRAYREKIQKEKELAEKYPKWDDENICREGFNKTFVNKTAGTAVLPGSVTTPAAAAIAAATSSAPASSSATSPSASSSSSTSSTPSSTSASSGATLSPASAAIAAAKASAPAKPKLEINQDTPLTTMAKAAYATILASAGEQAVREFEAKAQYFAKAKSFKEYERRLLEFPEMAIPDTHTYLLLNCSDAMKKGKFVTSKRYLKASSIMQCCTEMGTRGAQMFFARMADPNPKYREDFERETEAYWERIKEKLPELKAISAGQADDADDEEFVDASDIIDIEQLDPETAAKLLAESE